VNVEHLEYEASRINSALNKLVDKKIVMDNSPDTLTKIKDSSAKATSAAGLYNLSERDNWLVSQSPQLDSHHIHSVPGLVE
jgi:hypothetical protein